VGTVGSILVVWCTEDVRVTATRVDAFSISVLLDAGASEPWWLTTVYGPTTEVLKPLFLDKLHVLRAALNGPWALARDFNMILNARDKSNANLNRRAMARFRAYINGIELKEACLLERRYTWSNKRDQPTLVRIDRWFGSVDWDGLYPNAMLTALSSSLSNHCPILMSTAVAFGSKRCVCFERFWSKLEGFTDIVVQSWGGGPAVTDPLWRLDRELRKLARDLQWWSVKRVSSIRDQLLVANEVILRLDSA
jgi:hypothetical protein